MKTRQDRKEMSVYKSYEAFKTRNLNLTKTCKLCLQTTILLLKSLKHFVKQPDICLEKRYTKYISPYLDAIFF